MELQSIAKAEQRWNQQSSGPAQLSGLRSIGDLASEYRSLFQQQTDLQQALFTARAAVDILIEQQATIVEETESLAEQIATRSAALSGTDALQAVRAAIVNLRKENGALDARVGLAQQLLMRARQRETFNRPDVERRESVDSDASEALLESQLCEEAR
jgi:hypothetical protein